MPLFQCRPLLEQGVFHQPDDEPSNTHFFGTKWRCWILPRAFTRVLGGGTGFASSSGPNKENQPRTTETPGPLTPPESIIDLRRALTMSREAKRAFSRSRDPEEVGRELCRIAIETGGFGRAWIGLVEAETGCLRASASACIHTDPLRTPHQHQGTHDVCTVHRAVRGGAGGPGGAQCRAAAPGGRDCPVRAGVPYPHGHGGSALPAFARGAPGGCPTGAPVAVVGVVQDVTGHRMVELEREKLEEQLRQAQKMESIGRLAGGVAHDFNNLLAPILGYAELLLMDRRFSGAGIDELQQIRKAAERARDLTRQLLAFGRRQLLSMQTHDLRHIVSDFAPLLRRTMREEISVHLTLPEQPVTVRVDAGQVQQVLMNLAVNAQDAVDGAGDITIEVSDTTLRDGDEVFHPELPRGMYAVMSVSDTGCGMDKATLGRLFEPFFTTKQEGKGTGLGLSTAFGIIRQHEGQITAYSEPGRGSTFRVYLPISRDAAASRRPEDDTGYLRGSEKILVVEDNAQVRDLTAKMLRKLGYEVRAAADLPGALAVMEAEGDTVSLVLTDVVMPHTNGRELFARLSGTGPC